ncbi:MAG: DUF642 domain-containing protein [Gemmatimonadota bacterium]|nr:DUF642 domain-containing protein [Gemmatimonadota bacterium]
MATKGLTVAVRASLAFLTIGRVAACDLGKLVSWNDGVNVLVDGSFEDGTTPDGPFKPTGQGYMSVKPGATTIPGWVVTGAARQDVAWVRDSNDFVPNGATDGHHFLDLTGIGDSTLSNGNFAGIAQTFATAAGKPYVLTFDIEVYRPNFPGPIAVHVSVSTAFNDPAFAQMSCPLDSQTDGRVTTRCSLNFQSRAASTTIRIFGETGKHYIGLDNVSVQCFAPLGRRGYCSS